MRPHLTPVSRFLSFLSLSFLSRVLTFAFLTLAMVPTFLTSTQAIAASSCPIESLGEKLEDCPWAGLARDLEQAPLENTSVIQLLSQKQPALFSQMSADATHKDWFDLWGQCINFDELAKGIIVSPKIVESLVDFFAPTSGKPFEVNGRQILHAGVQHTYGYLFSNLQTSFGYKRARWVRTTLDRGFGLPIGTLSPLPQAGSLFSNATYFAGKIAFKNEPAALRTLENSAAEIVSPALLTYDFDSLKTVRLEETVKTDSGNVVIRTDFVPFREKVEGDSNSYWLIYSIADQRIIPGRALTSSSQLITAFPVEASFVETVLKPEGLGEDKPIITRYNAYVEGLSFKALSGTRRKL
jgi:hypothetical protein